MAGDGSHCTPTHSDLARMDKDERKQWGKRYDRTSLPRKILNSSHSDTLRIRSFFIAFFIKKSSFHAGPHAIHNLNFRIDSLGDLM